MKKSIGIISIHPAPYRDKTYQRFVSINENKLNVDVILLFSVDIGHTYQDISNNSYSEIKLKKSFSFLGFTWHNGIIQLLNRKKYNSMLIPGYSHFTTIYIFFYCLLRGIPIVFSTDEIHNGDLKGLKKLRKCLITKFYASKSAVFVVPGKASEEYLSEYGVKPEKIYQGTYCLDVKELRESAELYRRARLDNRRSLGISDDSIVFIYAGRFLGVRDILSLVKAYEVARKSQDNIRLILIGDGEEKVRIKKYIIDKRLTGIILHDFVKISEIGKFYTLSDVYIITSLHEHYSLACMQAAICSLPVISTSSVGAVKDVVIEGDNGLVVKPGDITSISDAMIKMISWKEKLVAMGVRSFKLVEKRDIEWASEELGKAFSMSLNSERR